VRGFFEIFCPSYMYFAPLFAQSNDLREVMVATLLSGNVSHRVRRCEAMERGAFFVQHFMSPFLEGGRGVKLLIISRIRTPQYCGVPTVNCVFYICQSCIISYT
jgi:hypothetical protein